MPSIHHIPYANISVYMPVNVYATAIRVHHVYIHSINNKSIYLYIRVYKSTHILHMITHVSIEPATITISVNMRVAVGHADP